LRSKAMGASKLVNNEVMLGRLPVTVRYPLGPFYQPDSSYLSAWHGRFGARHGNLSYLRPFLLALVFAAIDLFPERGIFTPGERWPS